MKGDVQLHGHLDLGDGVPQLAVSPDMTVRRASANDAEALRQLYMECDLRWGWTKKRTEQYILEDSRAVFVAVRNGTVIGSITLTRGLDTQEASVDNVAVSNACRRQGIGSRLAAELLDLCATEGVCRLQLDVWKSNEPAVRLYRKYGFRFD